MIYDYNNNLNSIEGIPACGYASCDDPNVRNTYTTNPNVQIQISWIYFNCNQTFASSLPYQIQQTIAATNLIYIPFGINFYSTLTLLPCSGTDGTINYSVLTQNLVTTAVSKERPNYLSQGKIVIFTGVYTDPTVAGYAYLPVSGQYQGIVMIANIGLGATSLTVAHELGHIFGLWHTFTGISEQPCGSCYETTANSNLDTYGDFCADTAVNPINFVCSSPLTGYTEPCGSRTTWSPNPYQNIMSYGNCRASFSQCQINRIRCYRQFSTMTWITSSPWPNGQAPPPQTSVKPPPGNSPGCPTCNGNTFILSIIIVVIIILFLL